MNMYRPLKEKFQDGPILTKRPYYSPWFFGVLRRAKFWRKALTKDHGLLVKCSREPNEHIQTLEREISRWPNFDKKALL